MTATNAHQWAASVAQRLKLVQANWVGEDASTRREYLAGELSRSLDGVPSSERPAFLSELGQHFPQWHQSEGATAVSSNASGSAAPASAEEAMAHFLHLARDLPETEKHLFGERLRAAGFTPPTAAAIEAGESEDLFDLGPEVIRRLRLKPGTAINSGRVLRLLTHMLESVLAIDDLVWNLWQKIAPQSEIRRKSRADLRFLVGAYLSNDTKVSFSEVTEAMQMSRKVNTSILGALGPLGRTFAKRYQEKVSPEAVREAIDLEGGGGFLKAKAVQYWQKYEEVSKDMDDQAVARMIQEILASYAEELMLGAAAKQFTRNPIR